MPVINGKPRKARYTSLKLEELSSVDRPAQTGAKAVIMKRHHDDELHKRGTTMTKTIEELTAENADLTAKLAKACGELDDLKAKMGEQETELEETKKSLAAATDETVSVGGESFRKSEVGDVSFRAMKAMANERDTARFEKAASEQYPTLVGTATEKGAVLKAMATMDTETAKALTSILDAAEKMAKAGFDRIGTAYPGVSQPTAKAAQATYDAKVAEIAKRDGISQTAAMQKARTEFPDEFAAAYPN